MRASDKNLQQRNEASAGREYRVNRSAHSIPCKCACAVWVPMHARRATPRAARAAQENVLPTNLLQGSLQVEAELAHLGVRNSTNLGLIAQETIAGKSARVAATKSAPAVQFEFSPVGPAQ